MADSNLTKHLMEIKETLYKGVEDEIANDANSAPQLDVEGLDNETKLVIINIYSKQQAQMHSLRMSTLRTWTKVIDSLIAVSSATDKLENKISLPWYKDPRSLALGFVMFVLILVMVFRLFEINPAAALGTTNFGGKMIDGATDITKSVTKSGSSGSSSSGYGGYGGYGNDRSSYDYGYTPGDKSPGKAY